MLVDRRPEYRKDAFTFGTVSHAGAADLSCLVWDLTAMGAKIELEPPNAVPDRFALAVGEDGAPVPCTVIWRSGPRLGVAFLPAAE